MALALILIAQAAIKLMAIKSMLGNHFAARVLHAGMRFLLRYLVVCLLALRTLLGADVAMATDAAGAMPLVVHAAMEEAPRLPVEKMHSGSAPCGEATGQTMNCSTAAVDCDACAGCAFSHAAALPLPSAQSVAGALAPTLAAYKGLAFASAPVALAFRPPIARRLG